MSAIKHVSTELFRATNIQQTLGTKRAASYMRNRGWSLEAALWMLCKTTTKGVN